MSVRGRDRKRGSGEHRLRADRRAYGLRARSDLVAPTTGPVALRARIRMCRVARPPRSLSVPSQRGRVRTVALDVHKRFAEVAVHEQGEVRRLGRIETHELGTFAESLRADDHVVLESTSMTWAIAELLGRHAGRVTVSNPMRTKAIASAKVKTDKVDAKVLAQLAAADFLPAVWAPDEQTRALRRRVSHRASLVRQRTRLRNQVHAVLARNLVEAPVTDLFGQRGRRWLAGVELPAHEREQVDSNLRLHDALDAELEAVDGQLAQRALADVDVRRLMTIPGVGRGDGTLVAGRDRRGGALPQHKAAGRLPRPRPSGAPVR